MNKKIVLLLFLLILMVSITITYVFLNQKTNEENQYNTSDKTVNAEDVSSEIDDMFIEENNEIEIGDII